MKPRELLATYRSAAPSQPRAAWQDAVAATRLLAVLTVDTAVLVAVIPGLDDTVRTVVSVQLTGIPHTLSQAASIAANNLLIAGSILLVAVLQPRVGRLGRLVCDGLVVSIVARSALLVGAVIGATGSPIAPFLVHLPFEWAGVGVAAGAWLHARRTALTRRELLSLAAVCLVLLLIAAAIETYATPR